MHFPFLLKVKRVLLSWSFVSHVKMSLEILMRPQLGPEICDVMTYPYEDPCIDLALDTKSRIFF